MIPPTMELADSRQESARKLAPAGPGSGCGAVDLFTFLSREAEKTLRHSAGLSVPQSAFDGSRLAIPCPGTGPLHRRSPPAPLAAHQGPAAKPTSSFCRKKRRRGAPSCVSAGEESLTAAAVMPGAGTPLLAGGRAAASKPASLPATAPSPRLAAPPPMPSSLAPAQCSEATPDELEERLRFFPRQIKTFRETSLMYSSPELMERIGQMERDYETAVRQFTAVHLPRQDSRELLLLQSSPRQDSRELPGLTHHSLTHHSLSLPGLTHHSLTHHSLSLPGLTPQPNTPQPVSARPDTPQPDTPQPDLKSASTSSTRHRGSRKRDASVHATGGLCDTSAPAHATEGPGDASAPAHATEGLCDASAPAHATEGLCNASALAHVTEGPTDASAPSLQGFSGKLVLVLASEPCNEGFEEEEPPDPVSGDFKGQFVLVLASEPLDEGFEEEAPPDPVSGDFKGQFVLVLASEPLDEGFEEEAPPDPVSGDFKEQFVLVLASEPRDEGSPGADLPLRVRQAFLVARLNSVPARDDLLVARLNSVPAWDDLLVARLNSRLPQVVWLQKQARIITPPVLCFGCLQP
ncbi:hypothetical protein CRENBAI_025910 [Crenichthys baileyi]|uniref:Uncharacterized protein n=1 Tax=Crenichthys baileyi TaxID=28760 RepID=A0AAV9S6B4_9TELE